jgi:biotin carboxylase
VEEAPSASVTEQMRHDMGEMAVRFAKPLDITLPEPSNLLWTKMVHIISWK